MTLGHMMACCLHHRLPGRDCHLNAEPVGLCPVQMLGSVRNLLCRRFYAPSTFPSFLRFPPSSSLPAYLAQLQTDNKSCRVIYAAFGCTQHRSDIYGNSSRHEAAEGLRLRW